MLAYRDLRSRNNDGTPFRSANRMYLYECSGVDRAKIEMAFELGIETVAR